jgi:hypothetical protein
VAVLPFMAANFGKKEVNPLTSNHQPNKLNKLKASTVTPQRNGTERMTSKVLRTGGVWGSAGMVFVNDLSEFGQE